MAPEEHKIPIELQGQHEETSNQSAAPSQPTQDTHDASTREPGPDQQLEPADSGPAAWRMLFAAFMFEGLLWGLLSKINLLTITDRPKSRIPAFFWSLPELLHPASRIQGKSVYHTCRYNVIWYPIFRRPDHDCHCQTVPKSSSEHHLGRLATLYPRTCCWLVRE